VDVLTKASRETQDAAANKSSSAADQPASSSSTQSSANTPAPTGTNAATVLNATVATAGAETATVLAASAQAAATPVASQPVLPQQNGVSAASANLTGASALDLGSVEALEASADQTTILQTAALDGQLTADKVADPTASSEIPSANVENPTSGISPPGKLEKSNTADSNLSATDHTQSAALGASSPVSAGSGPSSTSAAHATGGPSAQSVQTAQEMADRVADALRSGFDSGGELRVRLEPPALGKVQIEVQSDAGSVSARLEVQTPAARQTLLDNISMLHDAIGQAGATVNRIDIEVVPQQQHHDSTDSDSRNANSGSQQQDSGANSQDQSSNRGGTQQQNSNWRRTAAIDELDIEI
jgi:flagellar hook-length control protein FliK